MEFPKSRIEIHNLQLPPHTNEEAQLANLGYGEELTKGMDDIREWILIREQFQKLRANPYTTHIEYFANQIKTHLEYTRKVIHLSQNQKHRRPREMLEQRERLDHLEETAQTALLEERVTYLWWIEFNYKLAQIIDYPDHAKLGELPKAVFGEKWDILIQRFPLEMFLPVIDGDLGLMALNRSQFRGVYPLGLVDMRAQRFMLHDFLHANHYFISRKLDLPGHNLFHKKLLEVIEKLPPEERQIAEVIYFEITHESFKDVFSPFENLERVRKIITRSLDYPVKNGNYVNTLTHHPIGSERRQKTIGDYVEIFMKAYKEAQ